MYSKWDAAMLALHDDCLPFISLTNSTSAATLVCTQQLAQQTGYDDFAEIRSDMRRTARLIQRLPRSLLGSSSTRRRFSANDADDMEICGRGLEHLASRQVLKRLQDEQRTVKDAVLTLQSNLMAYVNSTAAGSTEDNAASNARLATDYSNASPTREPCAPPLQTQKRQ